MTVKRRHVLRGIGGFTLALPFLPSLENSAAAAPAGSPRRFIAMRSEHGALRAANMYPASTALTEQQTYAGYTIRRGPLNLAVSGPNASLSPVLTAPSSVFTQSLANKMNVIRGIDVGYYIAHHRGGSLGNFGESDDRIHNDRYRQTWHPTCDQVLSYSSKFYENLSGISVRAMTLGAGDMAYRCSNPENYADLSVYATARHPSASDILAVPSNFSSLRMFDDLFRNHMPAEPTAARTPILNMVMEDYRRLRNGNKRLSARDRVRLDDHMSRMDELDRKLTVTVSCGEVTRPTADSEQLFQDGVFRSVSRHTEYWRLMNDVIVAAMGCDVSRIATMRVGDMWYDSSAAWFSNYAGDWHQDIAHMALGAGPQGTLRDSKRAFFEHVFLDLASKLDAVDDPHGGKLLDSCAMFWTQESGPITHDPIAIPIVMAGGANGWLRTGSYIDYSDRNVIGHPASSGEQTQIGLLYNQFLGTLMQAMGLAPSDYEAVPGGGYGLHITETNSGFPSFGKYAGGKRNAAGSALPYLRA
jgi:hypothetical protein